MPSPSNATCWVIHDGAAGNRRQAMALASALSMPCREWALRPRGIARWLAPRRPPGASACFGAEFESALRGSPPSLAIGCGRIAALATRLATQVGITSVQVLDPRISTRHWDLVIAPEHDGLSGANVLPMLGSLNPVDAGWLGRARMDFPAIGKLASPRTAVLLGGPTAAVRFDHSALQLLCRHLDQWLARDGGCVLLCGSRRTPQAWANELRQRYRAPSNLVWMDESDGRNPYAAMLAWADRIVVSADSVNMVSEACATSVPVHVAAAEHATGRIAVFLRALKQRDRIGSLSESPEPMVSTPLAETARIAVQVRERLRLR